MPADLRTINRYKALATAHQGELNRGQIEELKNELRQLVQMGRYTGPGGVFIATGFRCDTERANFQDVTLIFSPICGGEPTAMPVINCLEFYTFIAPELI